MTDYTLKELEEDLEKIDSYWEEIREKPEVTFSAIADLGGKVSLWRGKGNDEEMIQVTMEDHGFYKTFTYTSSSPRRLERSKKHSITFGVHIPPNDSLNDMDKLGKYVPTFKTLLKEVAEYDSSGSGGI